MKNDPGPSAVLHRPGLTPPGSVRSGLSARAFFINEWLEFSVRRLLLSFCLVLLMVFSVGCAHPPGLVQRSPGVPFEISKLQERSDFWRDFQAKFRLRVDSPTSKFSSRAIILVKRPDLVRFETFTPLGQTAALYVFNPTGPALLIPSQKVVFTAQRPETLVREFLGVTLPVDVFRYLITASIPSGQLDHIVSKFESGTWRLIWNGDGSHFEWQVSAGSPALEGVFIRGPQFECRVSYDPPVALSREAVPDKIRISSNEWTMEIALEDLKPTSQFQPSAFYMPGLSDVRKVDLDKIK